MNVPAAIVLGSKRTTTATVESYRGRITSKCIASSPTTTYYWSIELDDGDTIELDDLEMVQSISLMPYKKLTKSSKKFSQQQTAPKNIMHETMSHILLHFNDLRNPPEFQEKSEQKYPQKLCTFKQNCLYSINKDNRQHVLHMPGEGRPQKRKVTTFCHGCRDSNGKPVAVCEMCYTLYHATNGTWKLDSSSVCENQWA